MADRLATVRRIAVPRFLRGHAGFFRKQVWLGAALGVLLMPSANADPGIERVRGYFCNAKNDSVAFLVEQAKGENEIMAANAVNKRIAEFSCAYYMRADAIRTGEQTVMEDGLVFKLQKFLFLPEKVERWSGTVFGSLQLGGPRQADI